MFNLISNPGCTSKSSNMVTLTVWNKAGFTCWLLCCCFYSETLLEVVNQDKSYKKKFGNAFQEPQNILALYFLE